MSAQNENKPTNRTSAYFLIALGLIGIATRLIADTGWNTVTIIKISISVLCLGAGIWGAFIKKQ